MIELGQGGWVRYIALFGLLCGPIIMIFTKYRATADPATVGVILLMTAKLIDIIPNSGIGPIAYMSAGALVGYIEMKSYKQKDLKRPDARNPRLLRTVETQYARTFSGTAGPTDEKVQRPVPDTAKKTGREITYRRAKPTRGYRA